MNTITPIIIPMSTGSSEPEKCPHCGENLPDEVSGKDFLLVTAITIFSIWFIGTMVVWITYTTSSYDQKSLFDILIGQVNFIFKLLRNIF